jgi:hypothetical protein
MVLDSSHKLHKKKNCHLQPIFAIKLISQIMLEQTLTLTINFCN